MKKSFLAAAAAALSVSLAFTAGCTSRNDSPAPAGSDSSFTVAFVPKLQGIPYFEAMNTGGKKAQESIPGLEWVYQGPTTADPAAQTDIVRSLIQKKVDVLVVAPNDPDSLAPILKEAAGAGIKVATSDTDAPNSVREVFVEQATATSIGQTTADQLAKAMGEKGTAVIVSCGETAANLNSWVKIEQDRFKEKYPKIKLLPTVYAGEDQAKATQMATDLMNANPDLTGIIGQCTTSAPGVAQAVRNAGKIGKVFTVGVGTPKAMLPYLEDGSSSASILWDVENLGYLTAWAGAQLHMDKSFQETQDVSESITDVKYDSTTKALILGPALVITKDNAGQYDY